VRLSANLRFHKVAPEPKQLPTPDIDVDVDPRYLDLRTSWRRVASFTFLPLYPRRKDHRFTLNRALGEILGWNLDRETGYSEFFSGVSQSIKVSG
jgi:hypothetical protein